jgi:hypothetical protein
LQRRAVEKHFFQNQIEMFRMFNPNRRKIRTRFKIANIWLFGTVTLFGVNKFVLDVIAVEGEMDLSLL